MSWVDELIKYITTPGWQLSGAESVWSPLSEANWGLLPPMGDDNPADAAGTKTAGMKWLLGLSAVGIGIAGAPFIYEAIRSRRRGKRSKEGIVVAESLERASTRATTLATALLPAFGLPLAYITVQALENTGTISKGLGNTVQTFIAAGAVAPAIGAIASLGK